MEWFEDEARVRVGGLRFERVRTGVGNVSSGSTSIDMSFAFVILFNSCITDFMKVIHLPGIID